MPVERVNDPAALIDAAQTAAAASDYVTAEGLLREAAAIQEATLGPSHRDLAATLNNLAFVCERLDKIADAEQGYRRAHAIAVASLPPGDPMTVTSLGNLTAFCAAHRIPLWTPPPVVDGEADASPSATEPAERSGSARSGLHTIGLLALAVLVLAAVALMLERSGRRTPPETVSRVAPAPTVVAPEPPKPAPTPETPVETRSAPVETRSAQVETPQPPATSVTPPAGLTVLTAQLCRALDKTGSPDWHCTPAAGTLPPGTYSFYTRLLTDRETTVEQRWYRDDRLHQSVRLHVIASPGVGYRTFSSTAISPERAGDWKVELRAADGTLLHEVSFVVR